MSFCPRRRADDPVGGRPFAAWKALTCVDASPPRRSPSMATGMPWRAEEALDRPDIGAAVAEALVREARRDSGGARRRGREQEDREGERNEAADRRVHGRKPSRSRQRRRPGELGAARRIGAGVAGRSRTATAMANATASRSAPRVGQLRPTGSALDPAGEERRRRTRRRHRPCRRPATAGTGTSTTPAAVTMRTGRGPSVTSTTAGPRSRTAAAGVDRRPVRGEIGEVVGADLDDVGARHDALEAVQVGRAVADDAAAGSSGRP